MLPLPSKCPLCDGQVVVTKIYCRECDTTIEGRFSVGPFANLTTEQIKFIQTFVRYEGKISHMEDELSLSYPTIRNRLHEVIRAMGYEPGGELIPRLSDDERQRILEELDQGEISIEDAMQSLREAE
jgi:hypothetical protein